MYRDPASVPELSSIADFVQRWLFEQLEENDAFADVSVDPDLQYRWYVRLEGEERDFTAVWLTLRQRTLAFESFITPAPEDNRAEVFETLLRWNHQLSGARFSIGAEDAIFIEGEIGYQTIDDYELDRILGTVYEAVERWFRPLLRLAFSSRLK
ncbi:MAG: YbjN domain-containing protein [Actinomycetia bacterium]|nr:YbjN domain-containing protein [Actinomycetes bacterium]MCP4958621.1 YbjN domain-containing protein [Actinomycetes bacterium]